MYQLYYSPGACSMAIHVALLECNQPVELVKVDTQNKTPEFLKVNPRGQVPVLVDGDNVRREGASILIHLLDKYKNPLLPQSGAARDTAIEWLMFCNATLHPAYARVFFLKKNGPNDATKDALMDVAVKMINKLWKDVEERLGHSAYLAGSEPTAADILMTVIANWSGNVPKPVEFGPNTKKLFQNIIARPSYKKAMETEQVTYKVAA